MKYAIAHTSGKQFFFLPERWYDIDLIKKAKLGSYLTLNKILLFKKSLQLQIGKPFLNKSILKRIIRVLILLSIVYSSKVSPAYAVKKGKKARKLFHTLRDIEIVSDDVSISINPEINLLPIFVEIISNLIGPIIKYISIKNSYCQIYNQKVLVMEMHLGILETRLELFMRLYFPLVNKILIIFLIFILFYQIIYFIKLTFKKPKK